MSVARREPGAASSLACVRTLRAPVQIRKQSLDQPRRWASRIETAGGERPRPRRAKIDADRAAIAPRDRAGAVHHRLLGMKNIRAVQLEELRPDRPRETKGPRVEPRRDVDPADRDLRVREPGRERRHVAFAVGVVSPADDRAVGAACRAEGPGFDLCKGLLVPAAVRDVESPADDGRLRVGRAGE